MPDPSTLAKVVNEFYGTFVLVLVINCSVAMGSGLAPFAIGMTLTAMVFCGGHISGGHYNPAVSLAVLIRDHHKKDDDKSKFTHFGLLEYWFAQILGGIFAAITGYCLTSGHVAPGPGENFSFAQAIGAEIVATMFLAYTVLSVATCTKSSPGHNSNDYYGLCIGLTVFAMAVGVGGISGGCFNPAVGTGLLVATSVAGESGIENLWIYWVADLLGAVLAAILFMLTNAREFEDSAKDYNRIGQDSEKADLIKTEDLDASDAELDA